MFDWFKRRRAEREAHLATLKAVSEALAQAAAERRAEALRSEALASDRRAEQEAFLQTLRSISEQNAKVVESVTSAVKAQADALAKHLSLFDTAAAPEGRTTRDIDEYREEVQRRAAMTGLPEEELAALMHMEHGILTDIDLN